MHEVSYKNNIKVSFNLCKREKVPSLDGEVANAFNIVAVFMILHVNGAELRLRKSTTFFLNTLRPYSVWHYQATPSPPGVFSCISLFSNFDFLMN